MTSHLIKREFVLIVTVILATNVVSGIIYCANHTYESSINTTHMQFTKEVVTQEYAIEGDFKGLHCCAKGYRSIEWWVIFMKEIIWKVSCASNVMFTNNFSLWLPSTRDQKHNVHVPSINLKNNLERKRAPTYDS